MTVTFHLKSGAAITAEAESIQIEKRNGNEICSYQLNNMKRADGIFYVRLDDISAITTED